jgi:putative aldouronate transport system substrate-binding protein
MKKFLVVLVALTVVTGTTLFANGKKEAKSERVTLSIFIGEPMPDYPEGGTIVGNRIKELVNVDFDFEFLVGDRATRTGIMLASGDYPDILNARGETSRFVDAGVAIPLNSLIEDHAPNLKKLIGDNYWEALKAADGNIYSIPDLIPHGSSASPTVDKAWWIQKAVLKDAGWPVIRTFEDYWKVLENYKNKYPTINGQATIAFMPLTFSWYKDYLYNASMLLEGKYPDNPVIDKVNGKWKVSQLNGSEGDYRYFKFMNDQFNKGLIEKEGFVADLDQYRSRISSGNVLGIFDEQWIFGPAHEILKQEHPDRMMVALPLTWDGGPSQYIYARGLSIGMGTIITTSCADPVAAIKFLDVLATDEIQTMGTWGVKDVDYSVDSEGKFHMSKEQVDKWDPNGDYFYPVLGAKYFYEHFPSLDGQLRDGNPTRFGRQPSVFQQTLGEHELEVLKAYKMETFSEIFQDTDPERAFYAPLWSIRAESGSTEDITFSRIKDLRDKYIALLITAKPEEFDSLWEEWMGQLKQDDLKMQEDFYQNEINKRLAVYGIDN